MGVELADKRDEEGVDVLNLVSLCCCLLVSLSGAGAWAGAWAGAGAGPGPGAGSVVARACAFREFNATALAAQVLFTSSWCWRESAKP